MNSKASSSTQSRGGATARDRHSSLPGDSPVTLDLQAVFNRCYDAGPYAREIDYVQERVTPSLLEGAVGGIPSSPGFRLEIARTGLLFPVTMWGDGSPGKFCGSHVPDKDTREPRPT